MIDENFFTMKISQSTVHAYAYIIHIYYSGSHKMKGTAHVLFCVTTWHTSGHACSRGVMLITGVVTLVTWPVTLVTCSYMRKVGGEAPAVGASWRQGS